MLCIILISRIIKTIMIFIILKHVMVTSDGILFVSNIELGEVLL